MVALAAAIGVLYPTAISLTDFTVQSVAGVESIVYWNTDILGTQPSQATFDAVTQEQVDAAMTVKQRVAAKALYDINITHTGEAKIRRALVLVLLDEINSLKQWLANFKVEIAATTTLDDLKVRIATLPATPDSTAAQTKTAITNKIDGGTVD